MYYRAWLLMCADLIVCEIVALLLHADGKAQLEHGILLQKESVMARHRGAKMQPFIWDRPCRQP